MPGTLQHIVGNRREKCRFLSLPVLIMFVGISLLLTNQIRMLIQQTRSFDNDSTLTETPRITQYVYQKEKVKQRNFFLDMGKSQVNNTTRIIQTTTTYQDNQNNDTNFTTQSQQLNPQEVDILPLYPWEIQSIQTRKCKPDAGIPDYCCPGSFSAGGRLLYRPQVCNYSQAYDDAKEHSLNYLRTKYSDSQQGICDSCKIIDYLLGHNLTLSFVGDSMTRQSSSGLECELRRRGYDVSTKKYHWKKNKNCSGLPLWKYCIGQKAQIRIIQNLGLPSQKMAYINHYGIYKPDPDPSNQEVEEEILSNSDIVIFDHGLHWNEVTTFSSDMSNYLSRFVGSNLKLLAWRETSSQHFGSDGGHYSEEGLNNKCKPMVKGKNGFRAGVMQMAAESVGLNWKNVLDRNFSSQPVQPNELIFLPFREYTIPLHYLHPEECTHYCHTPYLWLPLWRNIRIALERALSK